MKMSWLLSCIGCGTRNLPEKEEAKFLDFQHCSLTSVPPYIFECERCLEELYLDFNQITELPKELFHCHELQILSLSDNDLHNLPTAISSLSNLISLDLSKNGITDIPDNIKGCKKLRKVNASTNPLCRLPEGFTQLVALKELCLSDTFLEYLPANFGRLIGLEVLELRENQLNTLPRSMTRLTALRRLDLGQNEFTELPEVVGHLTSLTDLWFDNNRVKLIPPEIGNLHQLMFIDASKNRLHEIDPMIGNCGNLTDLFLTTNDLEALPNSLCVCTKMTTLHIDDNRLEVLPEKIGAFENLIELKASHNELLTLPSSVGLLRSLQFLHIDDNAINSLPLEIGSCASLVVLTAAHNELKQLPPEMGNLSKLRVLNLCGNSIQDLPVSFSKLKLTALWLSTNQAKPAVPLQCILDDTGSQKVLTCFMLPQGLQRTPSPILKDDYPLTEEELEARLARSSIHFASDGDKEPLGRLSRIPTPYPKELRALAKHTKNIQALKKNSAKDKNSSFPVMAVEPMVQSEKEKQSTNEVPNTLIALEKSSPSVKIAATVNSGCAAEPPIISKSEVNVGEKVGTYSNSQEVTSKSPYLSNLCQKTSNSTTETSTSPSSKNLPYFQSASYQVQISSSASPTRSQKRESSPKSLENTFDGKKLDFLSTQLPSPPEKQFITEDSLSNTSIGTANFSSNNKGPYLQRPGSLALEGSIPPWRNDRPGSLAAPINTVGLPLSSHAKRASSHGVLYGSSTPKNCSTPWIKDGKELSNDNCNVTYSVSQRSPSFESPSKLSSGQESGSLLNKEDQAYQFSRSVQSINETKEENETAFDENLQENQEYSSNSKVFTKDTKYSSETGQLPIEEEDIDSSNHFESHANQYPEKEHIPSFLSYAEADETFVIHKQAKGSENRLSNKEFTPSFIALSEDRISTSSSKVVQSTAIYSRIPHLKDKLSPSSTGPTSSEESKSMSDSKLKLSSQISSSGLSQVAGVSLTKESKYISDSKLKLSSQTSSSSLSQVTSGNKSKSNIPTMSPSGQVSIKRELSLEKNYSSKQDKIELLPSPSNHESYSKGSRIPPMSTLAELRDLPDGKYNNLKKKESNIPVPGKSLSPSSTERESNIAFIGKQQPYHYSSERDSNINFSERQLLKSPPSRANVAALNIPVAERHLMKSKTERESNIPLPGKQPFLLSSEQKSNVGIQLKPSYSSTPQKDSQIQRSVKQMYKSPADAESHIPLLNPSLSPVEKPINQTGIPMISPSDKSTRIPTFANSSLKGKKSGGIPSLAQKPLKHQVSSSERGPGRAWEE